jgi:hypothetical protein
VHWRKADTDVVRAPKRQRFGCVIRQRSRADWLDFLPHGVRAASIGGSTTRDVCCRNADQDGGMHCKRCRQFQNGRRIGPHTKK